MGHDSVVMCELVIGPSIQRIYIPHHKVGAPAQHCKPLSLATMDAINVPILDMQAPFQSTSRHRAMSNIQKDPQIFSHVLVIFSFHIRFVRTVKLMLSLDLLS